MKKKAILCSLSVGGLLAACLLSLASCGGDDDSAEGGQCQACRSAAPQCDAGLTCTRFQGNFSYALCATPSTTTCPVPF